MDDGRVMKDKYKVRHTNSGAELLFDINFQFSLFKEQTYPYLAPHYTRIGKKCGFFKLTGLLGLL